MRRLGREVARLHRRRSTMDVDLAVKIGTLLRQARTRLPHGSYEPWLEKHAGLSRSSAHEYVTVSQLAEDSPALFRRYRSLGFSNLRRIAELGAVQISALGKLSLATLRGMSTREFRGVVADLPRGSGTDAGRSMERRIVLLERRSRRLRKAIFELLDHHDPAPEDLADLHAILLEAAELVHG